MDAETKLSVYRIGGISQLLWRGERLGRRWSWEGFLPNCSRPTLFSLPVRNRILDPTSTDGGRTIRLVSSSVARHYIGAFDQPTYARNRAFPGRFPFQYGTGRTGNRLEFNTTGNGQFYVVVRGEPVEHRHMARPRIGGAGMTGATTPGGLTGNTPGIQEITPPRRALSSRQTLVIVLLVVVGALFASYDIVSFPMFTAAVNATIFGAQAEVAVAIGIGLEVWLHLLERREKQIPPTILLQPLTQASQSPPPAPVVPPTSPTQTVPSIENTPAKK